MGTKFGVMEFVENCVPSGKFDWKSFGNSGKEQKIFIDWSITVFLPRIDVQMGGPCRPGPSTARPGTV